MLNAADLTLPDIENVPSPATPHETAAGLAPPPELPVSHPATYIAVRATNMIFLFISILLQVDRLWLYGVIIEILTSVRFICSTAAQLATQIKAPAT